MSDVIGRTVSKCGSGVSVHVSRVCGQHAFITAAIPHVADPATTSREAYDGIASALCDAGMMILQERVFGSLSAKEAVLDARRQAFATRRIPADGPLTYLQGRPAWGEGFAGVIVHAVAGDEPSVLMDAGIACGRAWRDADTRLIVLQNLGGSSEAVLDAPPASQASRALQDAERILAQNGSDYRHVVRTWFYLSDILSWYGEFNHARTARYAELGLLPCDGVTQFLPASTGIRADGPGGGACRLDLLAVVERPDRCPRIRFLRNPSQREAFRYGSAFSRCAVVEMGEQKLIELSGTASIDEKGRSVHLGDIRAQVRCTLDKVTALLQQVNASLNDISAATLFVKNSAHVDAMWEVLADMGLESLPGVCVVADVCREELLFEIDAEALVPNS